MAKLVRPMQTKLGQPPGNLIHDGTVYSRETTLPRIEYSEDRVDETPPAASNALAPAFEKSVLWLDVDGVHDAPTIEAIGASAGIHTLLL